MEYITKAKKKEKGLLQLARYTKDTETVKIIEEYLNICLELDHSLNAEREEILNDPIVKAEIKTRDDFVKKEIEERSKSRKRGIIFSLGGLAGFFGSYLLFCNYFKKNFKYSQKSLIGCQVQKIT